MRAYFWILYFVEVIYLSVLMPIPICRLLKLRASLEIIDWNLELFKLCQSEVLFHSSYCLLYFWDLFAVFLGHVFLIQCMPSYFCLFLHQFLSITCSHLMSIEIYLFHDLSCLLCFFFSEFILLFVTEASNSHYQEAILILERSVHQPVCIWSVYLRTWVFSKIPLLWLAVFRIFLRCMFCLGTVSDIWYIFLPSLV